MSPVSSPASRSRPWLWLVLLLLGSVTVTVAWLFAALTTGTQAGWMAVVTALEAAWMLRLGAFPAGRARVIVTVLATVVITAAANWGIAATYIGGPMGLAPWESALRMGPYLAWTLLSLANGLAEAVWLVIALLVAWRAAR
ncbi:hypothetical protein [Stenotrophomonas sp.]|uniref:hypothetical protein n=1 Tax=Stenotrophomonas sp. TaxID=69392 RepID=UPI0028AC3901|nr:hypothetical protein [Stenotrophomonas sp.]